MDSASDDNKDISFEDEHGDVKVAGNGQRGRGGESKSARAEINDSKPCRGGPPGSQKRFEKTSVSSTAVCTRSRVGLLQECKQALCT